MSRFPLPSTPTLPAALPSSVWAAPSFQFLRPELGATLIPPTYTPHLIHQQSPGGSTFKIYLWCEHSSCLHDASLPQAVVLPEEHLV